VVRSSAGVVDHRVSGRDVGPGVVRLTGGRAPAGGFIVIGCFTTIGAAPGDRAAVRKIVERAHHQQPKGLRQQITSCRSRYTTLSPQESERLRGLIDLHNVIRDAPTTSTTHTLWRRRQG
jgi:hypothetical protein